jgi:hypothetical protein
MPPPSAADVARRMYGHESAAVAQACAAKAPAGLDETYVRLHVGTSAHADKIEVLEPRATPAFKRCVEAAVRAIAVPPDSEPAELVVGFKLHPPKLPPGFPMQ